MVNSNILTLPFTAAVVFFMIFTYSAEAIIFTNTLSIGDEETTKKYEDIKGGTSEKVASVYSFHQFLNINYEKAGELYRSSGPPGIINVIPSYSYDLEKGEAAVVISAMYSKYDSSYYDGVSWYNAKKSLSYAGYSIEILFDAEYDAYIHITTLDMTDNLMNLLNFLGKIPSFFGTLADLLTFNIKDRTEKNVFPAPVQFVILLFIIPLWILLIIGILPYIIRIVEAIGQLVDAVTPFT